MCRKYGAQVLFFSGYICLKIFLIKREMPMPFYSYLANGNEIFRKDCFYRKEGKWLRIIRLMLINCGYKSWKPLFFCPRLSFFAAKLELPLNFDECQLFQSILNFFYMGLMMIIRSLTVVNPPWVGQDILFSQLTIVAKVILASSTWYA